MFSSKRWKDTVSKPRGKCISKWYCSHSDNLIKCHYLDNRTYVDDQDKAKRLDAFLMQKDKLVEGCQELDASHFPVIQHGDLWRANIMFK